MKKKMLPLSSADLRPESLHLEDRCGPAPAHTAELASVCTVKTCNSKNITVAC